jgi:hypothetical protein
MLNAISFLILASFFIGSALYVGTIIGRDRERNRVRAIDADKHARAFREGSLKIAITDRDAVIDMLRRTPGFSIEVEEREHSDLVRVRGRNQSGIVVFEFTSAAGHLLTVQPLREAIGEVRS